MKLQYFRSCRNFDLGPIPQSGSVNAVKRLLKEPLLLVLLLGAVLFVAYGLARPW